MTIEVRQLLIRSQVGEPPQAPPRTLPSGRELEQVRAQVLAECKAWLAERLAAQRER